MGLAARRHRNVAIEVPFHHVESNTTLGSWFSDVTGINIDAAAAAQHLIDVVTQTINSISNSIHNIDWNLVSKNLQQVSHIVANVMLQTTPLYYVYQGLSTNPLTSHAFSELDKLTGGTITDITNLQTLPLRVVRGDPITKDECVRDGLLALKVAVVVLSGGTATSVISQASSQLSKGTLGQTTLGKDLLTVGGAAGLTALQGGSVADAIVKSGETVGLSAAQSEVVKKSPLGSTELGKIAIGAGFAAGGGEITGQGAVAGLSSFGKSTAISEGSKVAPGGGQAAGFLYDQAGNLSFGTGSSGGAGIDWSQLSQIPGKIADALSNIDLSNISVDLSKISLPGLPSFSVPSLSAPEVNVGQIPNITVPGLPGTQHVVSRTTKKKNGITYYDYTLDDGSTYEVEAASIWPYVLLAGIGVFFIAEGLD